MALPWIDISRPVRTDMPVWPGDPPTRLQRVQEQALGHACTVSALSLSVHAGTHVDAPLHYLPQGPGLDAWPLAAGVGRARVVAVQGPAITRELLVPLRPRAGERLLFATANSVRTDAGQTFDPDYVALTLDAARYLARRRVLLVGLDGPSAGPFDEPGGAVHRVLLEAGVWIVENLDLSAVPAGPAELVCLPLRLSGAEAGPARAVLRPLSGVRAKTPRP